MNRHSVALLMTICVVSLLSSSLSHAAVSGDLAMAAELTGQSLRNKDDVTKLTQSLKKFSSTAKVLGYDLQEYFSMLERSVQFGVRAGGNEQYLRSQTISANRTILGHEAGASLASRLGMAAPKLDRQGALDSHMYNAAAMDADEDIINTNARLYKLQNFLTHAEMTAFLDSLNGMNPKKQQREITLKANSSGVSSGAIRAARDAGKHLGSGIRGLYSNDAVHEFAQTLQDETLITRVLGSAANNLSFNGVANSADVMSQFWSISNWLGLEGAKVMMGEDYKAIGEVGKEFMERLINLGETRDEAKKQWQELADRAIRVDRKMGKKVLSSINETESVLPSLAVAFGAQFKMDLEAVCNR